MLHLLILLVAALGADRADPGGGSG
jgi:hypothetical protein